MLQVWLSTGSAKDVSGRRKTLERERLRLEKLLSQHPHWRMMRQAGGSARLVDGAWRFDGLGPAQASALRESLVFRAYQDVLMGLARLDAEAKGIASAPTNRSAIPQSHERARAEKPEAAPEAPPQQAAAAPKVASEAPGEGPTLTFRAKVEIKPVGGTSRVFSGETPQVAEPAAQAPQSAAVSSEANDDLTRIRAINRVLAQALVAAGVTSFRQIANWNSSDVRRIARELDLDNRIWREIGIEQAALLAGRDEEATKRSDSPPVPIPAAVSAPVIPDGGSDGSTFNPVAGLVSLAERREPADEVAPAVVPPEGGGPDEFTAIGDGLAPAQTEERDTDEPGTSGVQVLPSGFADMADGDDAPEAPVPPTTGASESRGREGRAVPAEPLEPAVASLEGEAGNDNAAPGPAAAVGPWAASIKAGRRPRQLPPPPLDRLTYIRGITDEIAERLRLSGVRSLEEIAAWGQSDVEWVRAILGDGARISADQWIEQAKLLASGRWTRHALLLVQGQMPARLVKRPEPVVARRRLASAASVAARAGAGQATVDNAMPAATGPVGVGVQEAMASGPLKALAPIAPGTSSARADEASAAPAPEVSDDVRPVQAGPESQPEAAGVAPQDQSGVRPDEVSGVEGATSNEGGGQSTLVEEATPLVVKPSDVARSTVALVAGELVGRMTPEVAPPGPEPECARDPRDTAEPDETGPTVNSTDGAADALDPLDDAVIPTPDSGVSAPPEVDPAMTDAEARSAAADDIDEGGTSDPQDRPEPEFAVGALDPADDFEDAEVLVICRKPAAEVVASSATGRAGAHEASDGARLAEAETARSEGSSAEADEDEFTPLGDEAAVRIVSRQGSPGERSGDADSREAVNRVRERLGYSPEYIARRMDVSDDEDDRDGYAGYRDAVEEATVTIIRAKGQEEPASAVVPDQIANDQDGSPEEADRARGDQQPKKRALGSRFLRALTGE